MKKLLGFVLVFLPASFLYVYGALGITDIPITIIFIIISAISILSGIYLIESK